MIEYTIIAVLSLALCLTYWRKNVWRRRHDILSAGWTSIYKSVGELGDRARDLNDLGLTLAGLQRVRSESKEWPETID